MSVIKLPPHSLMKGITSL